MKTTKVANAAVAAFFTALLVLPAAAADADGSGDAVPSVTLPPSTVLPNAPKVGDTAGGGGAAGPSVGAMAPVSPAAPTVAPNGPQVGDAHPSTVIEPGALSEHADWPCVQRMVPTISAAQIWDGPPIDDVKGYEKDEKIQDLLPYLQSRRVPIEDVEKAIQEYAASIPEAERDKKLTELFAAVLHSINTDRQFVMGRIIEFQRRQKARAKEIEREGQKLASLNQDIPADEQLGPRDSKLSPQQQEYNWNARIFQERQQNLALSCDIPTLIEQRAGDIARIIRQQMKS
jgi:hypothetical protein